MVVLSVIPSGHEILPEPGTACQARNPDQLADLRNPMHYPAIAVCLNCRQPVRCETWLLGEWFHMGEPEWRSVTATAPVGPA